MPKRRPTDIYRQFAIQQARRQGIDPRIFVRQINQESGFNPTARSGAGAIGIAQIVPRWHPGVNVNDPYASLKYAAQYMAGLYHKYGSYEKALSVYNSGQPDKYQDPNFSGGQTYNYVKNIMGGITGQAPSAGVPPKRFTALGSAAVPAPTQTLQQRLAPRVDQSKERGAALLRGLLQDQPIPELIKSVNSIQPPEQETPSLSTTLGRQNIPLPRPNVKLPKPKTSLEASAVGLAKEYLGTPYVWGGEKPGGFDCSGLVQYVWGKLGVGVPRTTYEQFKTGMSVKGNLQPGDAVFFHPGPNGPEHMGMYIGGGKFIEAPHTGANVRISELKSRMSDYMGARRFA